MRRSEQRALRLAAGAFRLGTRLLPPGFRAAWSDPMAEAFEDEARDILGVAGPALLSRLWVAAVFDLIRVAAQEWATVVSETRSAGAARAALGRGVMDSLFRDLRYSLHVLRRNPGFALAAVATLAIGIGLNTTLFSVASSVLFRPLSVPEPERLALVFAKGREPGYGRFSYADYRDFRDSTDAFASLSASKIAGATLQLEGDTRTLFGQIVTANYFETFGIATAQGRLFGEEVDTSPEHAAVIVLSHRAWQRYFGGDPGAVGRAVTLNGRAFTVVGVAPERFRGAYNFWFAPEYWAPIAALPLIEADQVESFEQRGQSYVHIVGRLREGASFATAQAQIEGVASQLERDHPDTNRDRRAHVLAELDTRPEVDVNQGARLALGVFQALAGLVLLVACANVSNLLLARAAARRREVAVRLAIGASRSRLLRQLLTEGLVLASLSALLGVGLAMVLVERMSAVSLPTFFPIDLNLAVDGRSLLFAVVVATLTALAFALVPALQASRPDLVPALKGEGPRDAGRRPPFSGSLVAGQVAVSLMLLVAGGLFLRSMQAAERVPLGFRTDHALLATLNLDQPGYDQKRRHRLMLDLVERVAALPEVEGASYAAPVPMEFSSDGGLVYADGRELSGTADEGERIAWTAVGPDYFQVMGTPLVSGRAFDGADDLESPRVAIVNETLAERFWPGRSPIGRVLRFEARDAEPVEVVGVAKDGKYRSLLEPPTPYIYRPLLQRNADGPTLIVRTRGEPEAVTPALRAALRGLDAGIPLMEVKSFDDLIEGRAMLGFRMGAGLGGTVGVMALALAMVGLYGMVALGVSRRTREIGIRMALGAERRRVVALVVGQGMRLVVIGIGVGLLAALGLGQLLAGLLVGVGGSDPATLAAVVALLAAVGAVATWLPARRAARVDPSRALRSE